MKSILAMMLGIGALIGIGLFPGGSAGAASTATPDSYQAVDAPSLDSSVWSAIEKKLLNAHNAERQSAGLSALGATNALGKAAGKRCQETIERWSHTRPNGKSPFTVLAEFNISWRYAGENIAYGYSSVGSVMNGWMNSSGHRTNILRSSFSKVGLGHCQNSNGTHYWVALFIG